MDGRSEEEKGAKSSSMFVIDVLRVISWEAGLQNRGKVKEQRRGVQTEL